MASARRSYAWSCVVLRMWGPWLDPAEITEVLGIEPDDSAKKGDLWGPKRNRVCRQGVWTLFGRPGNARIETQMRNILKEIAPAKGRLRRLIQEDKRIRGVLVDIGYTPRPGLVIGCFTLKADLVKEFVSLGIDVEKSFHLAPEHWPQTEDEQET